MYRDENYKRAKEELRAELMEFVKEKCNEFRFKTHVDIKALYLNFDEITAFGDKKRSYELSSINIETDLEP
ncbi:hypothetical protein KPC_3782 [Acinetobacter stercoris]|uniref:Uncharacterized protein n=2 Tax=Acinetobacter stercoris TaxID=2126983 RepID=A0A2U3N4Q7_9GAMM|nr:hypothetical protein [Acinetobacter sp. Marseille-Q1620]SPL72604.1 hypothetical protein KPC_3782 [Acinetobacter stercoris]